MPAPVGELMAVYVDDAAIPFGRMVMCHMIADSTDELLAMADKVGVARRWVQAAGTAREHFDICRSKRALAIRHGAVEIGPRELMHKLRERKLRESSPQDADSPGGPDHAR